MVTLAAVMLTLYSVALPAAAFVALKPKRPVSVDSKAADVAAKMATHPLGMLVRGYRPSVWWWEMTVVGRKVAMALISVFVHEANVQQALTMLVLFGLTGAPRGAEQWQR